MTEEQRKFNPLLRGMAVIITTVEVQNRKHHKRRINKKWRKKYGCTEYEKQPEGTIYEYDGKLYMTRKDFERLKEALKFH